MLTSYFDLNADLIENTQPNNNGWYNKQDVSQSLAHTHIRCINVRQISDRASLKASESVTLYNT